MTGWSPAPRTRNLATAALLGAGARFLPEGAVEAVNVGIASFSALYALLDIRDDLWTSSVRGRSDAQLLADLRATGKKLGLLINFNVPLLKDGIRRVIA